MRLYRSHRTEDLADALIDCLQARAGDPFRTEVVVVQSAGMARWLTHAIAERLGICANVRFEFPAKVVRSLTGGGPVDDPYAPQTLKWRILSVLGGRLGEEAFSPLRADAHGLAGPSPVVDQRALSLAARLGDLFDRYVTWRPELIRAWEQGGDPLGCAGTADAWQPELWRELTVGDHLAARAAQRQAPQASGHSLFFFGMPTLPALYLEILAGLVEPEISLFVPVPTRFHLEGQVGPRQLLAAERKGGSAGEHLEEGHPLLMGQGRLAREFQTLLELHADRIDEREVDSATPVGLSLLSRIQRDLVEALAPAPWAREANEWLEDTSLVVNACHSSMRQVEVLRDDLLTLLAADPTLETRDILVLTPDLEAFAPLVSAVFGDEGVVPTLRFELADQSVSSGNPWAEALLLAFDLALGRLPASGMLDLLSLAPLTTRYGLGGEALSECRRLVAESGVRWGIDAAHRQREGQPADVQNTWRFGLDRLLLGMALPEGPDGAPGEPFAGVLPMPGMEGGVVEALAGLVAAHDDLLGHFEALGEPATVDGWEARLRALLESWSRGERRPEGQSAVLTLLSRAAAEARAGGLALPLAADAARAWIGEVLSSVNDDDAASSFLSGGVTFAALVPMRSIPFRVICLLGMDDGAFPRNPPQPAYDLMSRHRKPGDRSPRDDDRHLFLEAVLSARDALRIYYVGFDIRTNTRRAPSVVVEELLEVAYAMGAPMALLRPHPLQVFSPRNFGEDAAGHAVAPVSFDERALRGALALRDEPVPPAPFLSRRVEIGQRPKRVTVNELVRFFESPAAAFLRNRIGVAAPGEAQATSDREPFTLGGLDRWGVRDRILQALWAGQPTSAARVLPRLEGRLPLGTPGEAELEGHLALAGRLVDEAGPLRGGQHLAPTPVSFHHDGLEVEGTIGDLYPGGRVLVTASSLSGKLLARLWVRHVFWQVSHPDAGPSHLVSSGDGGAQHLCLLPLPSALERASELVELYQAGQAAPLRLFPDTSLAYVEAWREAVADGARDVVAEAMRAARSAWEGTEDRPGEGYGFEVSRLFGAVSIEDIDTAAAGLEPAPEETFEVVSCRFFAALLDAREGTK